MGGLWLSQHQHHTTLLIIVLTLMHKASLNIGGDSLRESGARHRESWRTVTFTSIVEPPFLYANPTDMGQGTVQYDGFIPDLVTKIGSKLRGRRYRLKLVTNGGYGVQDSSGHWNGMVGEVLTGEADVAIGALSIRPSRRAVLDFTLPFMQVGIAAVIKDSPQTASFVSILDLANQSEVSYGIIPGSQTYYYFRHSNYTVVRQMWDRISSAQPSVYEAGSKDGIQRVRSANGTYAFILEEVFAEYLAGQGPCELRVLDHILNPADYALAVRKNSPLLQPLNDIIRTLKDKGTIDKLKRKWWKGPCKVSRSRTVADGQTPSAKDDGSTIQASDSSKPYIPYSQDHNFDHSMSGCSKPAAFIFLIISSIITF